MILNTTYNIKFVIHNKIFVLVINYIIIMIFDRKQPKKEKKEMKIITE